MHDYAIVVFAVLFYFLAATLYNLFITPALQQKMMKKMLGGDEEEDWTADHTESALNLDRNN